MKFRSNKNGLICLFGSGLILFSFPGWADQVELVNGDRYFGKILGVTETNVTLQSEIVGVMRVPRAKVTTITFGDKPAAPAPPAQPATKPVRTDSSPAPAPLHDLAAEIKAHGIDANSIKQVREQILGATSPEVTAKFNETIGGLMTGRISLDDIRAQARTSVKELQSAKAELGEEFGSVLDGYLRILQSFLNETTPGASAPTKSKGKTIEPLEQEFPLDKDE